MKTLTTLTAVAALIAGISLAAAQSNPAPKSGAMGSSSGSSMGSKQATGSGKFCIENSPSGGLDCKYTTMAACEKDAKAQGHNCAPNPNSGTTGSKQ